MDFIDLFKENSEIKFRSKVQEWIGKYVFSLDYLHPW